MNELDCFRGYLNLNLNQLEDEVDYLNYELRKSKCEFNREKNVSFLPLYFENKLITNSINYIIDFK